MDVVAVHGESVFLLIRRQVAVGTLHCRAIECLDNRGIVGCVDMHRTGGSTTGVMSLIGTAGTRLWRLSIVRDCNCQTSDYLLIFSVCHRLPLQRRLRRGSTVLQLHFRTGIDPSSWG